jgi:hypothetical protein
MTAEIREALASFLADTNPVNREVQKLAARFQVLPVTIDWTAFSGLTREGQFVWVEHDPPHTMTPVDGRDRHLMLARAGLRYKLLSQLIPERSTEAHDCEMCGGTGTPLVAREIGVTNVVCQCGGLGWLR